MKRDVQSSVSFNGEEVKVHERHDENHVEEIFDKDVELLDNIATSVAPIPVKLEALEIIDLAKIAHHFANTRISEDKILEFDKAFIKCLRRIFGIGNTITTIEHVTNQKLKAALELDYLPLSTALLELHILSAC